MLDDAAGSAFAEAAALAAGRGAPDLAASLWQRAAEVSLDDAGRLERLLAAAGAWWDACDTEHALATTQEVLRLATGPTMRAEAIDIRAEAIGWMADSAAAADLLEAGAEEVTDVEPVAAARLLLRASLHRGLAGRTRAAYEHAARAAGLVDRADPVWIGCRAVRGLAAQRLGERELADADVAEALVLTELPVEVLAPALPAVQALALTLLSQERWVDAERAARLAITAGRHHGLDGTLNFSSAVLGEVLLRTGRLSDALASASWYLASDGSRRASTTPFALAVTARVEALLGRFGDARANAGEALEIGERVGQGTLVAWAQSALGHVAMLTGNIEEAVSRLGAARDAHAEVVDPGELWYHGDLGEVLIAAGRTGAADELAASVAECAARADSAWGASVALRLRGLITDDPRLVADAARMAVDAAAPLEAARAMLLLGERFGDADSARRAWSTFERCGAEPWAARARAVVGGRRPSVVALTALLTDAELRVAVAVARGESTREVASGLFISPRTVDAHLRRIYGKLGIRTRSQLTALVVRELG